MGMNSKLNLIFVSIASMLGFVLFQDNLKAQDILPSRTIDITGSIFPILKNWKLADKIEEGKQLLENSAPLKFIEIPQRNKKGKVIKKKGLTVLELTRKEIALAVLDTQTSQIFEKRYWLDEADIKKANAIRRNYDENPENLPRFQPTEIGEEYSVITNWWNNHNSDLSVVKYGAGRGRYVVVANKFLMNNDDLAYPEDRTGAKYSDTVYVPYSKALKNRNLIISGKTFLDYHVEEVFEEMAQAGVMSKAFPGRIVTETMTQTFVKNIFLTEQIDPMMMFASNDGGLEQAERVFIRLGTNKEKAFRYTVSKTGASGLGQIMPKTYASMFKGYASAQLIKNVDIGRVDIKNGIKATVLVLDDHLAGVKSRAYASGSAARRRFDSLAPDKLEEARGMAYNGGAGKYNPSTGGLNTKSKGAKETAGFLQKFRMIRELNLFDRYAEVQAVQQ